MRHRFWETHLTQTLHLPASHLAATSTRQFGPVIKATRGQHGNPNSLVATDEAGVRRRRL